MPNYHFKVMTPQGTAFDAEVRHTLIPVENGFVGVLASHAPMVASSAGGRLEIDGKDGTKIIFKVGAGFFTVVNNEASFLTDSFEAENKASR